MDVLSGHLQGIGAELSLREGEVMVVNTIKGSPAEKAGLTPKDIIVTVDGKSLQGLTLNEIVSIIRGKKGTTVTLSVIHGSENQARTFKIVRDDIRVPSTEYEVKKTATGSVGILTINQFGADTIAEVQAILKEIDPKALKGLVIDLRYKNPVLTY